jgi:hypothetical protein
MVAMAGYSGVGIFDGIYNNKCCGRGLLQAKEYSDKTVSNLAEFVSSSAFINT